MYVDQIMLIDTLVREPYLKMTLIWIHHHIMMVNVLKSSYGI